MNIEIYLILIMAFISLFLIIKLLSIYKGLGKFLSVMEDIRFGNLNRRAHIGGVGKLFMQLCGSFNSLMNQFEKINERMQFLESSRKKMISDISHDLRTPLTSMIGYIDAMQSDHKLTEEEKIKYLDIVAIKSQTIFSLLQDFFELSKLESDESILEYKKQDLSEIIRQVLASFYQDFIKEKMEPDIRILENPVYVWGDDRMIVRIITNLLTNSLRYGKDGGIIGIELRENEDKVWVDIWDRGKGIPEKDIGHIFERLYTAEPSRNSSLQGSGLGLSIAWKLVEKLRGEITVKSIPFERTVFTFYLYKYE